MNNFTTGMKWRWLLVLATVGLLIGGWAALQPEADAQDQVGTGLIDLFLEGPSGQAFSFTTTGGLTPSSFDMENDDRKLFPSLAPGTYGIELSPPRGFDGNISCVSIGDVTTEVDGLAVEITIPPGNNVSAAGCDYVMFEIAPVPACIRKIVGFNAEEVGIDLEGDPPPWTFDVQADNQPVPLEDPGEIEEYCEDFPGFFLYPGEVFTIGETIDTDVATKVALTEAYCSVPEGDGTTDVPADDTGVVTATAPPSGSVECTFVNETIEVCVAKEIGLGASRAGASITDFTFSLNESTPQAPGQSGCEGADQVQYFVAPGSTFTLAEQLPADSPIRPVSIECSQFVQAQEQRFDVGEANLETASITVETSIDVLGPIDCVFRNDALVVCVAKHIDGDTLAQRSAGSFTFQLTVPGQDSLELVPGPFAELCPRKILQLRVVGPPMPPTAVVGAVLPPGTTFSIGEDDPGPHVGLSFASCFVGETPYPLAPGALTIENISPNDESLIFCDFFNESVLVCVTKQSDGPAFGITEGGIFDAIANGALVADDVMPAPSSEGNPCEVGEGAQSFHFYVAPGSAVTLTETVPLGSPLGLVHAECFTNGDGPQSIPTTLTGQTASFQADENLTVNCTLVNSFKVVCVTKTVGAGAQAVGFTAADFEFSVMFDGVVAPQVDETCRSREIGETPVGFAFAPGSASVTVQESNIGVNTLPYAPTEIRCETEGVSPIVGDLGAESVTFDPGGEFVVNCFFTNDTVVLCVVKHVEPTVEAAGFTASQFPFVVTDGEATVTSHATGCHGEDSSSQASYAYALRPDAEGTVTVTESASPADAEAGLIFARCHPAVGDSTTDLEARTVVSSKSADENGGLLCEFINDSVLVTLDKTLITDDGVVASVGDFLFDVFDGEGAAVHTGLVSGAKFYVAPGSTFTISERNAPGFASDAQCVEAAPSEFQPLDAAASVTHTVSSGVVLVSCTFVNDDIPPVPVCAMLIFEEGSTGFVLDDFIFELFKDGAIIGQARAGDPFDSACEDTTDNTADLLPGNLVQLGTAFPDGTSLSFAVSIDDPDELLEFDPLSCSPDTADAAQTQALSGPDPITFTIDPGATRVTCLVRANPKPPVVIPGGGSSVPAFERPTFVEPVVAVAASVPAAAAPVIAVAAPIAVTGSSTTGVTAPFGMALLSAGFLGLGLGRRRHRRSTN